MYIPTEKSRDSEGRRTCETTGDRGRHGQKTVPLTGCGQLAYIGNIELYTCIPICGTESLTLARQAFYHLSHTASPASWLLLLFYSGHSVPVSLLGCRGSGPGHMGPPASHALDQHNVGLA
jgi:hypothetical protein